MISFSNKPAIKGNMCIGIVLIFIMKLEKISFTDVKW